MGYILEKLLGLPFFWGLVIGTVIFVFYVAMGGLLAVVWTNVAQFIFMWLGLIILAPYVFNKVGGWFRCSAGSKRSLLDGRLLGEPHWSWIYLVSWNVVWFVAYCTRVELVTKMFAARDHKMARCSLPWTILLVMIFLLYGNLYLGGVARLLVWDQIASPDQAFPTLVATLLPPDSRRHRSYRYRRRCDVHDRLSLTDVGRRRRSRHLAQMHPRAARGHQGRKVLFACFAHYDRGHRCSGFAGLAAGHRTHSSDRVLRGCHRGSDVLFPAGGGTHVSPGEQEAAIASSVGGTITTVLWIAWTLIGVEWAADLHPVIPGMAVAGILMFVVSVFTPPVGEAAT